MPEELRGAAPQALHLTVDGEDVPRRVLEPGDRRSGASGDALFVLLEAVVALEAHSPRGQLVDRLLDVVDREVEDRVGRRGEVRLVIDERVAVAGDVQREKAVLLVEDRGFQPEHPRVELVRLLDVVDREAAVRLGVLEHWSLLLFDPVRPTNGAYG